MTESESRPNQSWPPIAIGVFGFTVLLGLIIIGYWLWLIAQGPEEMESMFDQTEKNPENSEEVVGPPPADAP